MEDINEKVPSEVITNDTENRTTINPEEAPPDKQKLFERLRAYNTGLWNGPERENKEAMHRQDDLQLLDAIASKVGLSDYQIERSRVLLDDLEINEITAPGVGAEGAIWGLCVVVANADVPNGTRYWPHDDAGSNDLKFASLAQRLDLDLSDQMRIVNRVGVRVDP